ncbi:MAG TPA: sigma-70 family RNA polymerase sigma factor [Solirubrobacteraceae bacterium]|jgi:RNA polymerase sigma-70 factor (ECF subfamily)|nr:sigma-70 family RNA polymerase sigma factor [Solirubrobacteraceae bacterium]
MTIGAEDFSRLYRRHAQSLLVFFQRRVDDPELATDLMADTFTMALDRREQFRGSTEEELSGWLWSIAQSTLRDHERRGEVAQRGARRLGAERRALSDWEIERIEELAGRAQLREAAARRLNELPTEQREAVRLRILEDLPYEQVASRLGLTVEATRMRVSRALRQLAQELKDDPEAPRP